MDRRLWSPIILCLLPACGVFAPIPDPDLATEDASGDSSSGDAAEIGPETGSDSRDAADSFDATEDSISDTAPDVGRHDSVTESAIDSASDVVETAVDTTVADVADACATACPTGANCGTIPDKCSGTTRCGPDTCSGTGQTCGGGGTSNVCGCTPTTTTCPSSYCGSITDECGGPISCPILCSPTFECVANACKCTATSCPGSCSSGTCTTTSSVSLGQAHSCSLMKDGSVRCWGANGDGQLGTGTTFASTRPQTPTGLDHGVIRISTGAGSFGCRAIPGGGTECTHSVTCAVLSDLTVRCWGKGYLGDGTYGESDSPKDVGLSSVQEIASSGEGTPGVTANHACVLLTDGTLRCWGSNEAGQVGDGTTAAVVTPKDIGLTNVAAVGVGLRHSCAVVKPDYSVRCWGDNTSGQLGNGGTTPSSVPTPVTGLTNVLRVVAGVNFTCALMFTGDLQCWGALTGDGTTTPSSSPKLVSGLTGLAAVGAGSNHVCAVTLGGDVYCWGDDSSGQLGDAGTTGVYAPKLVSAIAGATKVACGNHHTCVTMTDGGARCWGFDGSGELGDGSTTGGPSPVSVVW